MTSSSRLGYRVRMLSKAIDGLIGAHLEARHGLSLREGLLLVTLRREPGTHAQDLAAMTGIDKSQVSRCLDALVQRGLVRPAKGEADQRFKTYAFSPDGEALADAVAAALQAFNRHALAGLSAAESAQLFALLDRIGAQLEAAPPGWPEAAAADADARWFVGLQNWSRGSA